MCKYQLIDSYTGNSYCKAKYSDVKHCNSSFVSVWTQALTSCKKHRRSDATILIYNYSMFS